MVKAATMAEMILLTLNYPKRTAELAKIVGYMHDIGNIVNRIGPCTERCGNGFPIAGPDGDGPGGDSHGHQCYR